MERRDVLKTAELGLAAVADGLADGKHVPRHGEVKKWRSVPGLAGFEPAFQFLERDDLASLKEGRYPLVGTDVYAMISTLKTHDPAGAKFETHRNYIDVHSLIAGEETIGYADASALETVKPYDPSDDAVLFSVPASYGKLEMHPGLFAVFFPGQAHLPGCNLNGVHEIRKVVVKVAVAYQKAHAG